MGPEAVKHDDRPAVFKVAPGNNLHLGLTTITTVIPILHPPPTTIFSFTPKYFSRTHTEGYARDVIT